MYIFTIKNIKSLAIQRFKGNGKTKNKQKKHTPYKFVSQDLRSSVATVFVSAGRFSVQRSVFLLVWRCIILQYYNSVRSGIL